MTRSVRTCEALPTWFPFGDSDTSESSVADSESPYPREAVVRRKVIRAVGNRPGLAAVKAADATIVFDWDDTLFPTWYVCNVVLACMHDECLMGGEPLEPDSSFYASLAAHAQILESTLRKASTLGHVAIVTLGQNTWVRESAAKWLPMLDIEALFKELGIQVIYARDCIKKQHVTMSKHDEGVNLYTIAKSMGIAKVVRRRRKRGVFNGNVMCMGDSHFEHDAVKDLLWGMAEEVPNMNPTCKTVRFMTDPSLNELGLQLECLTKFMQPMAAGRDDFDISLYKR